MRLIWQGIWLGAHRRQVLLWLCLTCAHNTRLVTPAQDLPPVGTKITVYAAPLGQLPAVWQGDSGTR